MNSSRHRSIAGLFMLALSAACAEAAPGSLRHDASDLFFERDAVFRIRIEITGKDLETLRAHSRTYVRCTVWEGGDVYRNVAIHLKGAAGSFRPIDDKPALTLNFDKFVDGQRDVVLVCELRSSGGRVLFESLELARRPGPK